MTVKYAYGTHAGLRREINEDRVGIFKVADVFTVALLLDGMGGVNGGRIASSTAYDVMATELELRLSFLLCDTEPIRLKNIGGVLLSACKVVNSAVREKARTDRSLHGMGTTMLAAVCYGAHCCILNVGDSRGYYLADGQVAQITKDQSYLQYLLDRDEIDPKQAENFAEKNVIMSAIGTEETVSADLYYLSFQEDKEEYLLLSSDGLHDMVSEEEIGKIVFQNEYTLGEKIEKLIDGANSSGGEDNISAALLCVRKVG